MSDDLRSHRNVAKRVFVLRKMAWITLTSELTIGYNQSLTIDHAS